MSDSKCKSQSESQHDRYHSVHEYIVADTEIAVFFCQDHTEVVQIARHGAVEKVAILDHFGHTPLKIIEFHFVKVAEKQQVGLLVKSILKEKKGGGVGEEKRTQGGCGKEKEKKNG